MRSCSRSWLGRTPRCRQDGVAYGASRHNGLQRHVAVTVPNGSSPWFDLAATERMAGAAVTRRADRRDEREALDGKLASATDSEG